MRSIIRLSLPTNKTLIGQILRLPLRLIPKKMAMPVLTGPMKGKKWIVGSGTHSCWLGFYEYRKQKLFCKMIKQGDTVFDLGAHVGFYSMLASGLIGTEGTAYAFEPLEENLYYLKQHIKINDIRNLSVMASAVSDSNETLMFAEGAGRSLGHLDKNGNKEVKSVSLDYLYEKQLIPVPDVIKIDIEGAEYKALLGAKNLLETSKPIIFLATHGSTVKNNCCRYLLSLGYSLHPVDKNELNDTDEILALP